MTTAHDEEDAEANAWIEDMLKVCEAVRAKHPTAKKTDHSREAFNQGRPKADVRDKMPCPICRTGTMHYAISGYNGHIHAKCDTASCIAFMQ